ncbi:hypothetical protein Tco_1255281 [Tanacetum coccineum]
MGASGGPLIGWAAPRYIWNARTATGDDHSAWKQVEMPLFYLKQNKGSKKAKTFETTSGLSQGGLNLNDEADGSGEEVREVRPIGQDRAKKKASASSRFESSSIAGGGLVDLEKASREAAELKRHELEIKCKTLELNLINKRDKDLLFYNSRIETLPPIQQEKIMKMKQEMKEDHDLDY